MAAPRQPFLLVFVFAVVCVLSAMALVYTKHESRKLFIELEGLSHERDELNIEWGQLQIDGLVPGINHCTFAQILSS